MEIPQQLHKRLTGGFRFFYPVQPDKRFSPMLAGAEDLNQGNAVFYGRAHFNGTIAHNF